MKRLLALFLATTLSLSTLSFVSADDKGLADAITAAKQYITVPAEQSEVDYRISEGENGNKLINLSWANDDEENYAETNVTLDLDGCLLYYNVYNNNSTYSRNSLSACSSAQSKAKADEFMRKVYGTASSSFRLEEKSIDNYSHSYTFKLYINNIAVSDSTTTVTIDPQNCSVVSFRGCGKEFLKANYPSADKIIDKRDAVRTLFDGKAPTPLYLLARKYNRKNAELKPFLAFNIPSTSAAVNAITGESENVKFYFRNIDATTNSKEMSMAADESADGASFTPEEMEAIEEAEGLISSKEAAKIIKDNFTAAKNIEFDHSYTAKNYYTGEKVIYITGDKASASVNAQTGKILSFYVYQQKSYSKNDKYSVDKADTVKKAKAVFAKLAPDELKKAGEADVSIYDYSHTVSVRLPRTEYGYVCEGNDLTLTFNEEGQVTSYRNSYISSLVYPKPVNVLKDNAAIDAMAEVFDFKLTYSVSEDYSAKLLYHFEESGLMDSASATEVDYEGKPVKKPVEPGIDDVDGHWCEEIVKTLFNNGYRINDTQFRPDQAITWQELETLYNDNGYKYVYNDPDNQSENDNKTLTRYELADYIMTHLGMSKLRGHSNLFAKTSYNDNIDNEYLPAVAIATEFGAMHGDNSGCFNGSKTVTRAEAAATLYNMLKSEQSEE